MLHAMSDVDVALKQVEMPDGIASESLSTILTGAD
jgi:hypothetical protein